MLAAAKQSNLSAFETSSSNQIFLNGSTSAASQVGRAFASSSGSMSHAN